MHESFRLGRIAGVRVGMHVSVLVIVAIVVAGLTLGRFPAVYPDLSPWAYLAAGAASAVLLLASLLAHELAHAVVARRNGVEVDGITLWLLGGLARLRGEARTPRAELQIAIVGPLASVLTAIVFAVIGLAVSAVTGPGLAVGVFGYLAGINVILAIFNMIPAAPLDGGRVLRAYLWWRRGDRTSSALTAARAGRVTGFILIAVGFVQVTVGLGFDGLWLAILGLFLVAAATAEEQQTQLHAALHGMTVGQAMTPNPVVARATQTVAELIEEVVLTHRFSTYPLVDDGRLAGLVTLNRVRAVPSDQRATSRLTDIACSAAEVPTARPHEPLVDLMPRMAGCTDGRAVVLDADDRIIGLITPTDISRAFQLSELRGTDPYPGNRGADLSSSYVKPTDTI